MPGASLAAGSPAHRVRANTAALRTSGCSSPNRDASRATTLWAAAPLNARAAPSRTCQAGDRDASSMARRLRCDVYCRIGRRQRLQAEDRYEIRHHRPLQKQHVAVGILAQLEVEAPLPVVAAGHVGAVVVEAPARFGAGQRCTDMVVDESARLVFDLRLGRSVGMAQRPVNQLVHIAQLLLGKTLRRSNIGQCRRRIRTGQIAEDKMRRSCSCAASTQDRRRRRARAR